MSFRCDIPCIVCAPSIGGGVGPVDPANPFVNLSSEAPDHDDFIGRRYSIGYPPLGSTWYAVGCIGWCLSEISQEDADLCAAQQAVLCQSTNWPLVEPNPQGPPPFLPRNRPVFYNNAQVCPFVCPDGSVYNFVVAAGIFASVFNQETADLMAYSYACNKAVANHMCLGTLSPVRTCSSALYNGSIIASTSNTPVSFEVVGSLPDGLLLVQNETTAFIQGTPTTPGDYSFTIRATDSIHQSVDKLVDLSIFGVSTITPMSDGAVGDAYSETLQYGGTARGTVVWAITNGDLPDGLTLNTSTGEISGTPTTEETQSFTVSVSDGILTCSKQLSIEVVSACGDPSTVRFFSDATFLTSGLDVTLAAASYGTNGYTNRQTVDGVPKVAVMQVHWGEPQIDAWQLLGSSTTDDFKAFASYSGGGFDTSVDKTIRIPVYPTASDIVCELFAPGSSGANMGDAHCVTSLECVGIEDFNAIVWGAPTVVQNGAGTASISGLGTSFNATVNNPGGGLDDADASINGTFVATGNGVAGKLTLTISNYTLSAGWPRFLFSANSNVDGDIWFCDSTNGWVAGAGVYVIPFVIGCTPGSIVTIHIEMRTVAGLGSLQRTTLAGTFATW